MSDTGHLATEKPPLDQQPEQKPTLAHQLAPVRNGDQTPHPRAVEITQRKIKDTTLSGLVGTVLAVAAPSIAAEVLELPLGDVLMGVAVILVAYFAGMKGDPETLKQLAMTIILRRKNGR